MKSIVLALCFSAAATVGQRVKSPQETDSDKLSQADSALSVAYENFNQAKNSLEEEFRKDYSRALALAEAAEILLLDFEMVGDLPEDGVVISSQIDEDIEDEAEAEISEYFFIKPYGALSKVLKRRRLEGDLLKELRTEVAKLLIQPDDGGSAFCHYPIHGIRLAGKNGEVIFETSVCYFCANYFLKYPDQFVGANWIDFNGEELEAFLKREMPIPQSELDRFAAKYPQKNKKK